MSIVALLLALPAAVQAQNFNISITMTGGGGLDAAAEPDDRAVNVEPVVLGANSAGAFPAGNYTCSATVTQGAGLCLYRVYVNLFNPSGLWLGGGEDSPWCSTGQASVQVYLDSNSPSGSYTCSVQAIAQTSEGNPVEGYGQRSADWGDGLSSDAASSLFSEALTQPTL